MCSARQVCQPEEHNDLITAKKSGDGRTWWAGSTTASYGGDLGSIALGPRGKGL